MPEPASLPALADDLMYSPPPAPRDLRWWAQRSLELLGRLLVGALICLMAAGSLILFAFALRIPFLPRYLEFWLWFI